MLTVDDGICKLAFLKGMRLKKESKMVEIDHSESYTSLFHFLCSSITLPTFRLQVFQNQHRMQEIASTEFERFYEIIFA